MDNELFHFITYFTKKELPQNICYDNLWYFNSRILLLQRENSTHVCYHNLTVEELYTFKNRG